MFNFCLNKCVAESIWMSIGWQQSYAELSVVVMVASLIKIPTHKSKTPHHATNKTLNKMPHHSTNTALMLNVTTFWNKTNTRLTLEDWNEKNATLCIQMENWHGGIPRHKSRSTMNMNTGNNILFQRELFHCHKFFTLWLNVTHLWALFRSSFCCSVHCSKTALMPFSLLYRHFLCAILAPCFVVFSSPPYRRDTSPQKKTHTYTNYVPVGTWVCPSSASAEDEQCFYSKPPKSKIRILILTMTPLKD